MIASMRELTKSLGCTFLLIHHRRKANQHVGVVQLQDEPQMWFQEAAGSHALVNQTDARIGVVPHPGKADLLVAGFVRGTGPLVPLDLARALDEDGNPMGYRLLTGLEHLSGDDRISFDKLGQKFRFKDVQEAMGGNSGSNATRLVKKCLSLQLIQKDGTGYVRTTSPVERVERMEEMHNV